MSDPFDDLFNELDEEADKAKTSQLDQLVERMQRARATYYNTPQDKFPKADGGAALDPLVISDAEYDAMEDELRRLDPEHELLKKVGQPALKSSGWEKVRHEAPMTSLNKAQPVEDDDDDDVDPHAEFRAWWKDCVEPLPQGDRARVVWSDKCDGISLSVKYKDGDQARALTRGDGEIGEDISRNVWMMKGRVEHVKGFTGHTRGEVVLRKSDWKKHFPDYANPRNAASGIAKRQNDPSGCKHLTVLHYQMIRDGGGAQITHKEIEFKALEHYGFAVPSWGVVDSVDEAIAVYEAFVAKRREALDYEIDGLVFEVNDLEAAEALGDRNHRPRAAIAYKFPHERKSSTLRGITWQVGKSGRVTPVANFDPVKLVGASVSNANLHNVSNIEKLVGSHRTAHLAVGDRILVSRRNDVIPCVESLLTAHPSGKILTTPTKCPSCGLPLSMHGEYLVCTNHLACPAQVAGLVQRWVKKIGLLGWGDTIIEALVAQDKIGEPADLYHLDPNELAEVELDGRKIGSTAHTVMAELKSKGMELPLHVFVGSLGIPLCARSVCKQIVDAGFDTLAKMRTATWQEIASIPRMGETKAQSFVDGLLLRCDVIDNLLAAGVVIKPPADGPMKGKTVCMTGFRDPSMVSAIEDQGGTVKSGVGKTLDYLVAKNPKSTSGKAKKARDYGVEIIGPDDMWQLLGGRP